VTALRKEPVVTSRHWLFAILSLGPLFAGCATPRTGVAYLQIEDDQIDDGGRAEPVYVDPRVEVLRNEYGRSYLNNGSSIRQTIHVRGPIMIVPAPRATTRPTAAP
jgi:hypothetical protein